MKRNPRKQPNARRHLSRSSTVKRMIVVILGEAIEMEIANAIDVANDSQDSFRFTMHPAIIQIDRPKYELANRAIDFDIAIDDLVKHQTRIQKLLPYNPIFVTSLPYSDKNLVNEFRGKSLANELSQCYFYELYTYPRGNVALISTFIWEHLPPNKNIDLPKSPSGRRALQPYLLCAFAAVALDPLANLPFHEETRGCPFDYCNNVRDIDESFRARNLCAEHEDFLRKQVTRGQLTKEQMNSALGLFNRAFDKPAKFDFDVAISFAGSERLIAEKLARAAKDAGFSVFLDDYYTAEMWGSNLIVYLQDVFRRKARYCVILISKEYALRMWTIHERRAAQERALEERGHAYILPVRIDGTRLEGMPTDLHYLDLRKLGINRVAKYLVKKLDP